MPWPSSAYLGLKPEVINHCRVHGTLLYTQLDLFEVGVFLCKLAQSKSRKNELVVRV